METQPHDDLNGLAHEAALKIETLTNRGSKLLRIMVAYLVLVLTVGLVFNIWTVYRVGNLAEVNAERLQRERAATEAGRDIIEEFRTLINQQIEAEKVNHQLLIRLEGVLDGLTRPTP